MAVNKRRWVMAAVLGAAGVAGFAAPALATTTRFGPLSTTAVRFDNSSGSGGDAANVAWHAAGTACSGVNCGPMEYWGYLHDTKADGDGVYVQAKVEGFGWSSAHWNSSGNGHSVWEDWNNYASGDSVVSHGWVQACVDDSIISDTCSVSGQLTR
jgi:hypothetical protein